MESTGSKPIRVLLADDHPVVMQGFATCLTDNGIEVVGQVKTPDEVVKHYEELRPDVLVLDIRFGDKQYGLYAAKELLTRFPDAKIVFLSQFDQDQLIQETYKMGAKAFLTKDCDAADLLTAVTVVNNGERYFLPKIAQRIADNSVGGGASPLASLDDRSIEVLKQLAKGSTIPEIAEKMNLSPKTISKTVQTLKTTLGIHRPADITMFAFKHGLIEP